ncbi:hypothetical protein TthSNM76_21790 (plasmid) [Thermus thermophilus]|nr:hypothetical protein TthSNM76_21790 [Thermus thermophilus]
MLRREGSAFGKEGRHLIVHLFPERVPGRQRHPGGQDPLQGAGGLGYGLGSQVFGLGCLSRAEGVQGLHHQGQAVPTRQPEGLRRLPPLQIGQGQEASQGPQAFLREGAEPGHHLRPLAFLQPGLGPGQGQADHLLRTLDEGVQAGGLLWVEVLNGPGVLQENGFVRPGQEGFLEDVVGPVGAALSPLDGKAMDGHEVMVGEAPGLQVLMPPEREARQGYQGLPLPRGHGGKPPLHLFLQRPGRESRAGQELFWTPHLRLSRGHEAGQKAEGEEVPPRQVQARPGVLEEAQEEVRPLRREVVDIVHPEVELGAGQLVQERPHQLGGRTGRGSLAQEGAVHQPQDLFRGAFPG